jgi:hypothetical protein
MDYLAEISHLPLRLAGNQLILNVEAPETVPDRGVLFYVAELWKPQSYRSGTYELYETLRGREVPPYEDAGLTIMEGCNFDLSDFAWGLLSATAPTLDQREITIQAELTCPIFTKSSVEPIEGTSVVSPIEHLIRARLNEDQFPAWQELFFTKYLAETRAFLTWQPDNKIVERDQPELLTFLVHFNPAPTALRLRVSVEFMDGTRSDTFTALSLTSVDNFGAYTIPVGFTALDLAAQETGGKEIFSYEVWVSDQDDKRLSQFRRYVLSQVYEPNLRYLVFLNNLGGWDTLRVYGSVDRSLSVDAIQARRSLEANYQPSSEEVFQVMPGTGERTMVVNTGDMPNQKWLEYLEELTWSERVYVATREGFIPIVRTSNTFTPPGDEEFLNSRTFNFMHSKEAKAYSDLPLGVIASARPTMWVPSGPFCLVNANGIRSGKKGFSKLELRYADGGQDRVKGVAKKNNLPGTLGYVPEFESSDCMATPYTNARIERPGTFKKQGCAGGQVGTVATIIIPATSFGSESSQAEADARAEAAWESYNTQAYATQYGACETSPELYTVTVPINHFHYRSNRPEKLGLYHLGPGGADKGNATIMQGQAGTYVFPIGSNDLDFPVEAGWYYHVYGNVNARIAVKIFQDGILRKSETPTIPSSGYHNAYMFDTVGVGGELYAPNSGDKFYILIEDL